MENTSEEYRPSQPLVTYEEWLSYEERYDDGSRVYNYDPDWYPPYYAPASQHMWADHVEWASTNFSIITKERGYGEQRKFIEYPPYVPFHPSWECRGQR